MILDVINFCPPGTPDHSLVTVGVGRATICKDVPEVSTGRAAALPPGQE